MNLLGRTKKNTIRAPQILLTEQAAHTHFAEAYRTLRTNIHLAGVEQNVRSLLVTSAGPTEGKTSVSVNLGWTIARQGKAVVLVDCDLRRPCLSKTVDSSTSMGLTGLAADILGGDLNDSGKNKDCGLADLLALIDLQKKTGKLLVQNEVDAVEFFFLNGKAADLAWLTCPQHLELSSLLYSEGLLSREQLDLAVKQRQGAAGHQISGMINKTGFVDEAKLKGLLSLHVAEALRQATAIAAPSFLFTELAEQQLNTDAAELIGLPQQVARAVFSKNDLPYIDGCIQQAVVQTEEYLAVLPAGMIPPNPSELAGSARLHFLLARLKHLYDFMIIDTPPVLPVSDALLLAPYTDGVIVVARVGFLNRVMIGKAIEQLRDAKANLLGVVLNQVDIKRDGYYQKYASGYYGEQGR